MKHPTGVLRAILAAVLLTASTSCLGRATAPGNSLRSITSSYMTAVPTSPVPGGLSERIVSVQEVRRTYLIHLPSRLNLIRPVPLVVVFHGFAESPLQARDYTGLDAIADTEGFLVVYPEGTGLSNTDLSWNGGSCCGYAAIDQVDEAAYVRAVLSDLKAFANIDPSRIYATGFANGAMLSYRLGCEMSDVFAAIAPVEGVFFYYGPCQPRKPVSLIHIHGLKDKVIPYAGTSLPGFGEQYPPVSFGIVTWARLDGCPASPQVSTKGVLTLTSYSPCQSGTAVELFTLEGLGHGWPTGNEAGGISSRTIWEFFAAHPKE